MLDTTVSLQSLAHVMLLKVDLSIRCQENQDTDMVDESNARQHKVVDKQTISNQDLVTTVQKGPSFEDEKIKLDDTLAFSYDYTCANSGYESRDFQVTAEYDTLMARLTLIGKLNIDAFGYPPVRFTNNAHPRDYEGGFKHSFCRTYEEVICTYNFYGNLGGEVYTHFVSLSITEASNNADQNPKIYENCVDFRAGPVCPSASGRSCTVHRVRFSHPVGNEAQTMSDGKSIEF